MITGELKSKVDSIWNTMWSGGISNPLSVIAYGATRRPRLANRRNKVGAKGATE